MTALGARARAVAVNDRFKLHGLSLMGDAMRALLAHLETTTASEHDAIDAVLKVLSATELSSSVVRKEMVESAIETLLSSAVEEGGVDGSSDGATTAAEATTTTMMMDGGALASVPADGLTVCDAFKTKRYAYDGQRRMFDEVSKAGGIECEAGSKIDLYRDRFLLLQQRLNRSRMFSQPTLTTSARQGLTLSSIQSLLGDVKESKLIMGCLSQLEDGVFYVEDLTGTVRVDLTACEKDVGLFTENCIVIAEGEVRSDGVFEVLQLMSPPSESRDETRKATNALDFFGAGHILRPNELEDLEQKEMDLVGERFIVISDVWLDQQRTFDRLEKMFDAFDAQDDVPGLIVFMGDFTSTPFGVTHYDFKAYTAGFVKLAELLQDFPRLRQESRFVFVPGPGDPGLGCALPRPALQPSLVGDFMEKVPRAQFASNPVKIRYYSQDLVFFREDLQAKMRRNCLIPPDDSKLDATEVAAPTFQHLAATLVKQAHLCPLPITQTPIYWEFDHALWLYPAPNAVFLGDRSEHQATTNFEETCLSNPGSFSTDGSFLVYCPATGETQFSAVP